MSNPNDRNVYNREVRRELHEDAQGNGQTRVTQTSSTIHNGPSDRTAYRDGYVNGQINERQLRQDDLNVRDNDNAARGLLLGILLTSLVGLTVGGLLFLTQRQEPVPVSPVIVPNSSPSPAATLSPSPAPQRDTTIIERTEVVPVPQQRTIERVVPVPQPQVSPNPQPIQSSPSPASQASPSPSVIVIPSPSPQVPTTQTVPPTSSQSPIVVPGTDTPANGQTGTGQPTAP